LVRKNDARVLPDIGVIVMPGDDTGRNVGLPLFLVVAINRQGSRDQSGEELPDDTIDDVN
jgi:hypothetical protein